MNVALSDRARRTTGLCGLLGALLFFTGDMLFYGHFGSAAQFHEGMLATLRNASLDRLFAGGLIGPVAACLCIVGFWHVRDNIRPTGGRLASLVFALFAMLMVAGSAIHTLWVARGIALKYCADAGEPCHSVLTAVQSYWSLAYNLGSIPGYLGAVILLLLVVTGRTYYPRWTIVANPALLYLLSPLAQRTPAPLGAILLGGFANLSIVTFFAVSCATTWPRRNSESS
jgi:hypothetical protein